MRILLISGLVIVLMAIGAQYSSPINPIAVTPQPIAQPKNHLQLIDRLQSAIIEQLPKSEVGPEDVAIDQQGCRYTGVANGNILRRCALEQNWTILFNTTGRPLGLSFDRQQRLLIADSVRGLLRWDPASNKPSPTLLVDQFEGQPLQLVNDVDVGPDGTIYFSDASQRWPLSHYLLDALEGYATGRLFAYRESDKQIQLLANNLAFANGVAVSADGRSVLVVESYTNRVIRIDLANNNRRDIFVEHLSGFPDGIARDSDGSFWLAMYAARDPLLESLWPYPFLKNILAHIPTTWLPKPRQAGFINHYDAEGNLLASYQDHGAVVDAYITSVEPVAGGIFFGRLHQSSIGFIDRRALVNSE